MAFADIKSNRPSPTAMTAVIAIHAAMGMGLLAGLTVDFEQVIEDPPIPIWDVKEPVEPPPPEQKVEPRADPATPPTFVPEPIIEIPAPNPPLIDTTDVLPPVGDVIRIPQPNPGPVVKPSPSMNFGEAAAPRNNPGGWITEADYRTSWINRGYTGTAKFELTVGTNGRVTDCVLLGSTGHEVLDTATCRLLAKRAKFTAARNAQGDKIAGKYSGSIRWQLPD